MYIDIAFIRARGKVYKRVLLRTSYREDGKVKHKTIANLSGRPDEEIEAIRFALKNKGDIERLLQGAASPQMKQGSAIGSIYALNVISKKLGISAALGHSRNSKLALWQILARVIAQGSRLSAVRLATLHAACDVLSLDSFTEDDLYQNLDWLSLNQKKIEKRLFDGGTSRSKVNLFLYDVTSSYTEGDLNEYANYGYNRDKKRGKKQIVIGLLTDIEGDPVSVQVFEGNTADSTTFVEQVHKIREQFGVENVIWVGDRGMIKQPQIETLPAGSQYVTAITRPQTLNLLKCGIISLTDFSDQVVEVAHKGIRYILRRNPVRVKEIELHRMQKLHALQRLIEERNQYLLEHPKAVIEKAVESVRLRAKKLKISTWVKITSSGRSLSHEIDNGQMQKESALDGCYVIKTNVEESTTAEKVHERYKDLSAVEWAFRTMKTTHLEIRPYYVQKKERTEGHVFVIMLAYKLIRYLREAWKTFDLTVEEGISILSGIYGFFSEGQKGCQYIPQPNKTAQELLAALAVELPGALPTMGVLVATRKKLKKAR